MTTESISINPEEDLQRRIKSIDDFINVQKSKGDLNSTTQKLETRLNRIKSDFNNPDISTETHINRMKLLIQKTKDERDSSKQDQSQPQEQQIKSTKIDKLAESIANGALAIAKMFARMFDKVFGTELAKSDLMNKPFKFGTVIQPVKQKEEIKISEAKQDEKDRENHPDGKLSIRDVLRGKYSDSDIQEQQDKLAEKGHRVFKVASNSKTQAQAVSR